MVKAPGCGPGHIGSIPVVHPMEKNKSFLALFFISQMHYHHPWIESF